VTVLAAQAWPTNADMILSVVELGYLRTDDLVLDPTYGLGRWWSKWRPVNLTASDIDPAKSLGWGSVDFTDIPWVDGHFDVVAFDPPYKLNGTASAPDAAYGVDVPSSWQGRHALIRDGLDECVRVAKPGGYILLKCQDQVCSGAVRWQTHEFTAHAESLGCRLVDALYMIGSRPQPAGRRQVHARRNLSTLLILQTAKTAPREAAS
jgi:hypothetical protein